MTEIAFADGFHTFATGADVQRSAASFNGSAPTLQADMAGEGGQSLRVAGAAFVRMPLSGDPGASWCIHTWLRMTSVPTSTGLQLGAGLTEVNGNVGVALWLNRNNTLSVRRGTSTLFTSEFAVLSTGAQYRLAVTEHPSTGTIQLWRNNDLLYDASGLDTSRTSAFDYDRLHLGYNTSPGTFEFAHVIVTDGENLGPTALVGADGPDSDEGPNEWTRNTGSTDHGAIDDLPHDGDTTHLLSEDTGVGDRTRHGYTVSLPNRRIVAAQVSPVARLAAAGGDRLQVGYHSGTADPVEHIVGGWQDGYSQRSGPWLSEDPDTEEEWTDAGLSALEVEVEHLAPEA